VKEKLTSKIFLYAKIHSSNSRQKIRYRPLALIISAPGMGSLHSKANRVEGLAVG
jgi:hypothetical protein